MKSQIHKKGFIALSWGCWVNQTKCAHGEKKKHICWKRWELPNTEHACWRLLSCLPVLCGNIAGSNYNNWYVLTDEETKIKKKSIKKTHQKISLTLTLISTCQILRCQGDHIYFFPGFYPLLLLNVITCYIAFTAIYRQSLRTLSAPTP